MQFQMIINIFYGCHLSGKGKFFSYIGGYRKCLTALKIHTRGEHETCYTGHTSLINLLILCRLSKSNMEQKVLWKELNCLVL